MLKCRLAELNISYNMHYDKFEDLASDYLIPNTMPTDFVVSISDDDIRYEKKIDYNNLKYFHDSLIEVTAALRKTANNLANYDAAIMHSCLFDVDGKGIAFGAPSGTGKTTHMMLWQQFLGDRLSIVNGDKPIIRIIDGKLYGYGSPWSGKERKQQNIRVPITDICKIERSIENKAFPLTETEAISLLMQQIYMPIENTARIKTLQLINRILYKVKFWKICCNMDRSAAEMSYNAILGKKNDFQK